MTAEIHFQDGDIHDDYEQVRLLDNGWVKATDEFGDDSYYPEGTVMMVAGRVYVGDANAI